MIQDKVVVITGGSSGIGYSTAKALAKKGAKIVAGARRLDKLETLKKEITDNGGEIIIHETDVTKKSFQFTRTWSTISNYFSFSKFFCPYHC